MHSIRSTLPTPPDLPDQFDHYMERLRGARSRKELNFIESQLTNILKDIPCYQTSSKQPVTV